MTTSDPGAASLAQRNAFLEELRKRPQIGLDYLAKISCAELNELLALAGAPSVGEPTHCPTCGTHRNFACQCGRQEGATALVYPRGSVGEPPLTPQEKYLVEKARDLERQQCAYVTTNHGVLMTYAEHQRLVGEPPSAPSELAQQLAKEWGDLLIEEHYFQFDDPVARFVRKCIEAVRASRAGADTPKENTE